MIVYKCIVVILKITQGLSWATRWVIQTHSLSGRRSSETLPTLHSVSLISSSAVDRLSGSGRVDWLFFCPTATKEWYAYHTLTHEKIFSILFFNNNYILYTVDVNCLRSDERWCVNQKNGGAITVHKIWKNRTFLLNRISLNCKVVRSGGACDLKSRSWRTCKEMKMRCASAAWFQIASSRPLRLCDLTKCDLGEMPDKLKFIFHVILFTLKC